MFLVKGVQGRQCLGFWSKLSLMSPGWGRYLSDVVAFAVLGSLILCCQYRELECKAWEVAALQAENLMP